MNIRAIVRAGLFAISLLLVAAFLFPTHNAAAGRDASLNGGAFVDPFNDGVIADSWVTLATTGSSIYEADGVLNMVIAAGAPPDNSNQLVDIGTREHVLKGDFDVQVSFQLDPQVYDPPEKQWVAKLSVEVNRDEVGKVRDGIHLAIFNSGYMVGEEHQDLDGGTWMDRGVAPADDLQGKLRLKRQGELVSAYYWGQGWVKLAEWVPELTSPADDLIIVLTAFNSPDFPSFWVKWDNLIAYYHTN